MSHIIRRGASQLIHFITFYSKKYHEQERRLRSLVTSLFPEAKYKSYDLDFEYRLTLYNESNKFGYFNFKPELLLRYIGEISENDIMIYLDTNDIPRHGLLEYVQERLNSNRYDLIVSSTNYLQLSMRHQKTSNFFSSVYTFMTGMKLQPEAGCVVIKKTDRSIKKLRLWLEHTRVISHLNFEVSDASSRHDQEALTNVLFETTGNLFENWFLYKITKKKCLRMYINFEGNRFA